MRPVFLVASGLLACLPLLAAGHQAEPDPAPRQVLKVDRYDDDEAPGSLRWAITTANAAPGTYRIEIAAVGAAPYVIKPRAPLPEIKGPVAIVGLPFAQSGQYVAIDGAAYVTGTGTQACPGAVPGQYGTNVRTTTLPGLVLRDTQGVELAGLEVRNFCIGVLINRSHDNWLHDNRIVANKGGAGVMLTGDDGNGQSTPTTTVHNRVVRNEFIDNGDGLELTRGAAWNLVADNLFRSTDANPEPSQGIEILWGNDNLVLRNRFEDYSDGLQINWGNRNTIAANTFTGNSIGVSLTGRDNVVDGNTITGNGIGVALRPQPVSRPNRITGNAIFGNGLKIERCQAGGACVPGQARGAIMFGVPGLEHADFVGSRGGGVESDPAKLAKICSARVTDHCQPAPNDGLAAPVVEQARRSGASLQIQGQLRGTANTVQRVEVFGNPRAADTEAARYLGDALVTTDAQGQARFSFAVPATADVAGVTATVTAVDGATSPLSAPRAVAR
ncbi:MULTISPECIES: NosD domain-containing protein [Pseudoxanthomonas]|uniref:3-dehydroshikimate dehydratase n=1 Tax=Pseudoxanthomonas winnipegensis TaxID=2480810 RepID=A0AAW8GDQ9_9GAMM|nr:MULTISPECIES: NosD domain-containing protein [Pseudoxanthomonas]MDQ1120595.1 3-dehydroshikimate dehydratase [Pseudoxanthomonas winnipegensis]MDQ1133818.1 3-dehydroshikimate dehydratase [Pseudoxanthomonas winnipegensis]MDR6139944.1 3-dehydroshikimate dehydratase [Pseudoxanthomonas sp. SORGH_AS_0997]